MRGLKQEHSLRVARVKKGVERGQGEVYPWRAKGQCSSGDKCRFERDEGKRAKPTPKTAPPAESQTKRGRSASRKKNLRGPCPSGKLARQSCRDYIKGQCKRPSCGYWHPPEGQFFEESGCKFGDKCSFAHMQVQGQPSTKPKKNGDKSTVGYSERCATV